MNDSAKQFLDYSGATIDSEMEELAELHSFYVPKISKAGLLTGVIVDEIRMIEILKENGFYRYDTNGGGFQFVHIDKKKIRKVTDVEIRDWWFEYIEDLPEFIWTYNVGEDILEYPVHSTLLLNEFQSKVSKYFVDKKLERLKPNEPFAMVKDLRDRKHVYFRNGFVTISKASGIEFKSSYDELDGFIWENQILDRDFDESLLPQFRESVFYKFCKNISGSPERLKALQTNIGYLCHDFFNYKRKAIIFTDSTIGKVGEANGRTGKGILAQGLSHFVSNQLADGGKVYAQVNGKDFVSTNKHKYHSADINTKLIHLEDVVSNFKIENLFNDITEGVTVDKKNEKPFHINAKIVISTNRTIKLDGASAMDRAIYFEFSQHYSMDYSPADEFGHWFFTEWDDKEWALFDCFMIECAFEFFQNGSVPIESEQISLKRRMLMEETSIEFLDYMDYLNFVDDDYVKEKPQGFHIIPQGLDEMEYCKQQLFEDFKTRYPDYTKVAQRTFTKWLSKYAEYSDILDSKINTRRSSGKDYILFRKK